VGRGPHTAAAAGGRYDGLVQEFGGPPTPAIGFAIGLERAALLLPDRPDRPLQYFIVAMGEPAREAGIKLLGQLRRRGQGVEMVLDERKSLKAQMKAAAKAGAKKIILVGEDELNRGVVQVKDMETGAQQEITLHELSSSTS
jgi:histidyl-tRNA synthetase